MQKEKKLVKEAIRPVSGYTLCETRVTEGGGILLHDGTKTGDKKLTFVVTTSEKDSVEWQKGDQIALKENVQAFDMGENKLLIPNEYIIAILCV